MTPPMGQRYGLGGDFNTAQTVVTPPVGSRALAVANSQDAVKSAAGPDASEVEAPLGELPAVSAAPTPRLFGHDGYR